MKLINNVRLVKLIKNGFSSNCGTHVYLRYARVPKISSTLPEYRLERCLYQSNVFKYSSATSFKVTAKNEEIKLENDSTKNKTNFALTLGSVPTPFEKIVERLPDRIKLYAQLMRLHKPTGVWLLLWPTYWSVGLATQAGHYPDPSILLLVGMGALLMRGAGCTINDMWDKNYDSHVKRTKNRPLASGAITPIEALSFLALQLSLSLSILLQFDINSILLGASSLSLVVIYPLMKRYTFWPQLVLGMTFNWGALLGWSIATNGSLYLAGALPLYTAGIFWTLIYDTIYAHQDKVDDLKLGLKSTAIKFGDKTKIWLSFFSTGMISSLLVTGITTSQIWPYYGALGLISLKLLNQITTLDIDDPDDCWKKFKDNTQIGWILFTGIFLSTLIKDDKKKLSESIVKDLV